MFVRNNKKGEELVCVMNFSPVERPSYEFEVQKGTYEEVFNSNLEKYGGDGKTNGTVKTKILGGKSVLTIDVPAYTAMFFKKKPNKVVVK